MLRSVSKSFLYLSLFSVVVVMTSTFFPFIGGKYYLFRVAVEFSLICFLLWWAFEATPEESAELSARFRGFVSSPLFLAVSAFVLIYLLASVFAYDPHAAFWSNYERGEGGFQMLHYYAFFVLLGLLFTAWRDWRLAFYCSLAAAVLMIFYGVFAASGISGFVAPGGRVSEQTSLWRALSGTRFQGSLGNPAYVAPYLMFSIFYALYLWFHRQWRNAGIQRIIFGGLTLVFALFFFLSQTRGAFLGIITALFIFFLYLAFAAKEKRKFATLVLVALVAVGGILFSLRNAPFLESIPGGRVFQISFGERTVQTRLWTWQSAWEGFKERPLLGWGPENFSTAFDKYFDPRHFVIGENSETWFDRAHSVFFDYLAETGILGLLAYAGIFFVLYLELFRNARRTREGKQFAGTLPLQALVVSLPAGYLVQGLVLFDVLPIYLNLFLFLAFALFQFQLVTSHEPRA